LGESLGPPRRMAKESPVRVVFQACRNGVAKRSTSPCRLALSHREVKQRRVASSRSSGPQAISTSLSEAPASARRNTWHHIFRPGACSKTGQSSDVAIQARTRTSQAPPLRMLICDQDWRAAELRLACHLDRPSRPPQPLLVVDVRNLHQAPQNFQGSAWH